jgi:hypothetical protein
VRNQNGADIASPVRRLERQINCLEPKGPILGANIYAGNGLRHQRDPTPSATKREGEAHAK